MISHFFILSCRGDTLIYRDYRGDCSVKSVPEIFYRRVKASKGTDPPPVFNIEDINFIFIKHYGLYFVCTTKFNMSSALVIDILTRITNICKDYCGVLNEDSIKLNFPLIYELLDEILDFGYVQVTSTETLKGFVYNEPKEVTTADGLAHEWSAGAVYGTDTMCLPGSAANKPVLSSIVCKVQKGQKSEIFMDLIERLTVLFSSNGDILRSELDGSIQMKSFITGAPTVRIRLNEDLMIGRSAVHNMNVRLDDCNFHQSVDLSEFDNNRTLLVSPPEGEFTVMRYSLSDLQGSNLPFTLITFVDEVQSSGCLEVILKVRCNIPPANSTNSMTVRLQVPKATENVSHNLSAGLQSAEYNSAEKALLWKIRKIQGGSEVSATIKIHLSEKSKAAKQELGPVSLEFEIPMYICSGLQVRFLKVYEQDKSYSPFRWIRYITHSDSYVVRM